MPKHSQICKSNEPKLHKLSEKITEILIYFTIIFSTWAFGTTELWSIWTVNISAYALGIILIIKLIIRYIYASIVIDRNNGEFIISQKQKIVKFLTSVLLVSMCMFLIYILISAINAKATYDYDSKLYTYFDDVQKGLPHSYDARSTWIIFWQYLSLIIIFSGSAYLFFQITPISFFEPKGTSTKSPILLLIFAL